MTVDPSLRSDARIRVELSKSGGVQIALESKVESMYGAAIRRQLDEGCAALGVEHAQIRVEDGGALPFVLAARLEAAVRAVDPDLDREWLPEMRPENAQPSERERFRRSRLYLPSIWRTASRRRRSRAPASSSGTRSGSSTGEPRSGWSGSTRA